MKPILPPPMPGKTEWERFDHAMSQVFSRASQSCFAAEK